MLRRDDPYVKPFRTRRVSVLFRTARVQSSSVVS